MEDLLAGTYPKDIAAAIAKETAKLRMDAEAQAEANGGPVSPFDPVTLSGPVAPGPTQGDSWLDALTPAERAQVLADRATLNRRWRSQEAAQRANEAAQLTKNGSVDAAIRRLNAGLHR